MYIEKQDQETGFDYHKRLVYGKLVDKTFSDIDYSELSEPLYGQQYSSDHTRKMMRGSLMTAQANYTPAMAGIGAGRSINVYIDGIKYNTDEYVDSSINNFVENMIRRGQMYGGLA